MKRKLSKKGQLLVIGVLSLLVLCCLFGEAWNRGIFEEEAKEQQDTRKEKKDTESETEEAVQQRVKVLLMTEGFASLFHQTVRITSSEPFTVTENGAEKTYAAGEVFECDGDTYAAGQKLVCKPQKGAKLKILSFQRQNRYPSYRGNLRLTWKKKGILITNQISLEEYLYAVVPSELSTSNKMEALKAQAVCARSYAYQQIRAAKYKKYHAHMDDSAAFQVYNNVPEDKRSRKAVDATKGMVLTSDGSVVQAYYYSTSWGYSASGQDVWNTGSPIAYLKNKLQVRETEKNKTYDLSSEEVFRDFIDNSSVDTYDSKASWYRWKVTISGESLSARIDAALASCYASNPELVLTQNASGQYEQKPLKSLGTLKKIRVEERKKSGLVTEIVLVGKKNVIKVCTQYNVRKVLAPVSEQVIYDQGHSKTTMSLLPSAAFYVLDVSKDNRQAFQFVGGGYGHGTGMSQCGAAAMAKEGKTYQEILAYYFDGTEILSLKDL